jgi:hypothetical protein
VDPNCVLLSPSNSAQGSPVETPSPPIADSIFIETGVIRERTSADAVPERLWSIADRAGSGGLASRPVADGDGARTSLLAPIAGLTPARKVSPTPTTAVPLIQLGFRFP